MQTVENINLIFLHFRYSNLNTIQIVITSTVLIRFSPFKSRNKEKFIIKLSVDQNFKFRPQNFFIQDFLENKA